ncbi:xylose import ATP-binding protein XylG, partial [Pseudomonas syringae pv. tagetis]
VIGDGQLRVDFINLELTQVQVLAAALSHQEDPHHNARKTA